MGSDKVKSEEVENGQPKMKTMCSVENFLRLCSLSKKSCKRQ